MVGDLHGQRAPAQVAVASSSTLTVARTGLWTLLAAHLVALWGLSWDIRWHLLIGRDSFWIAPHIMTYSGVAAIGFVSFGVFGWTGIRGFRGAGVLDVLRHLGGTGSRGYHLAALAITLTVLAAPLDELWHRMFGLDVTIWSPSGVAFARLPAFAESLPSTPETAAAAVLTTLAGLSGGALGNRAAALVQDAFLASVDDPVRA